MIRKIATVVAFALFVGYAGAQEIITENGKSYRLYKVEKGEGLYRISVNNNISQEELIQANPQLKTHGIVVGEMLRIPLKASALPQVHPTTSSTALHVVAKGETAYSICRHYSMKLADFYALNPGCEAGVSEGQQVRVTLQGGVVVPAYNTHTIAAGETLYRIGIKYGVTAQQILDVNPSLDVASLPIGTQVRIPSTAIPAEDANFYYHQIAAGETLFQLCNKYNLLQEKIMEVNPNINWNALHIGQMVAIPKVREPRPMYFTHEVKKRETLYGILRQYEITYDELKAANPTIDIDRLQKGAELRIPDKSAMVSAVPATVNPLYVGMENAVLDTAMTYSYEAAGRPMINVAVMLPFHAESEMYDRNAALADGAVAHEFKSRRYIEFCEGVRLAADSFAVSGANVTVHVYDTQGSALTVLNALNKPEMQSMDMIIGPSHIDQIKPVANFAMQSHVPAILPFAQMDSTINDNPYLIQASVIDTLMFKRLSVEMAKQCVGKRVVIYNVGVANRRDMLRTALLVQECQARNIDVAEYIYEPQEPTKILDLLRVDTANVLIMPTNDEAKVNNYVTMFASIIVSKPGSKVQLFGYGEWLTFQTIEVENFHKLNTQIFTTFALDYSDAQSQYTLGRFRDAFFTEPVSFTPYFNRNRAMSGFSEYALWGYDIAMKFIGAKIAYGNQFIRRINEYRPHLMQSNFNFESITNWGGMANTGLRNINFRPNNTIVVTDL